MSRPAAADLLAAFGRAMAERGGRWYVFGAQAVIVYGRPRLTADVDITVELLGYDTRAFVTDLAHYGFELRFPLSDAHFADARLLPMVHIPTLIPVDVVIAGPGLDEEFLERSCLIDVGGVAVPVVSIDDLIVMKVLAGRRKDIEDVRGILIEQRARVDLARVRALLLTIETATGERKLVSRFVRLVQKTRDVR